MDGFRAGYNEYKNFFRGLGTESPTPANASAASGARQMQLIIYKKLYSSLKNNKNTFKNIYLFL